MVLALLTPPSALVLPGWTYMILPLVMTPYGIRIGRQRQRLRDAG